MTEAEFKQELKCLNGGYLLYGEEDYLKYNYSKQVRSAVLDGTFDEFNHIVIYGEEYTPSVLASAIGSLPMMAEKKLVELRGVNFNQMKKSDLDELEELLSALPENDHTILLIRADSEYFDPGRLPKAPSEIFKMMSKHLKTVELSFPTESRLRSWIIRHFNEGKIKFDPLLCEELVNVCGHSMWTLSNEIEKLCAYAQMNEKSEITKADIDAVCSKTIEYDDFQLTNALLERNKELAFETLRRQKASHEPAHAILSSVVRLYSELLLVQGLYSKGMNKVQISSALGIHQFKVGKYLSAIYNTNPKKFARAVELCAEADVKSKSMSNVISYIAVERLVSSLCALFGR